MSHILNGKYQMERQKNGLHRVICWTNYPKEKTIKGIDLFQKEGMDLCETLTRKKDEIKLENQLLLKSI